MDSHSSKYFKNERSLQVHPGAKSFVFLKTKILFLAPDLPISNRYIEALEWM